MKRIEQAAHSVEVEALAHLGEEQRGQSTRMPEELRVGFGRRHRFRIRQCF